MFTVRLNEPRPPRQHFETNVEISQSHVEMHTMKSHIILLIFPPSFSFNSPEYP